MDRFVAENEYVESVRMVIVGRVAIPTRMWYYQASWPFAVLETFESGIGVWLQPRRLEKSIRIKYRHDFDAADEDFIWSIRWSDISSIKSASKSVYTKPAKRRGCRFAVLFGAKLQPIINEAAGRGVVIQEVVSTLPFLFSEK
jgi:hypothetical protein